MKDSGIEWIGEIPETWELGRNKNYFKCSKEIVGEASNDTQLLSLTTKGVRLKSETDTAGKVPESYDTYQTVEVDDIIMCLFDLDVSAVFSGISPYEGMISPAYKILKCNSLAVPKYVDYWFRYIFDGRKFKHFSKNLRYTLNYDEFAILPILIPTVDEQKRISDYLDQQCAHIDAVIEKTKASIEEYKKLKQAVITQAVTRGIRVDRPMKDSGMRFGVSIPKEWNAIIARFVIDSIGDVDHAMPESIDEGYPYLMIGDLKDLASDIDFSKAKKISEEDFNRLIKKTKTKKGDVIFARYATIGTATYVDIDDEFVVSYACVTVHPKQNVLLGKYLFYYFKSKTFYNDVQQYVNSNTQGNVGIEALLKTKIVMPPMEEQKEIVEYLDEKCKSMDELIIKKEQTVCELEAYKKSLIYEYVTGKKEVPHSCQ